MLKYYGWCLWEYQWLLSNQEKKKINCFWWHDCRYYGQWKHFVTLGKIFNKGLEKEEDKKEGLLKRLKILNIIG